MKVTDELLYQHMARARDLWLQAATPAREAVPEHAFSPRFRHKMAALLRSQRRPPALRAALLFARRAAVFALVFLTLSFSCLMAVDAAFRAKVIQVVTEVLQDFTHFSYSSDTPTEETPGNFTFTYLPDGMVEVTREANMLNCYIAFQDSLGNDFSVEQDIITPDTVMERYFDTEDAVITYFVIHGEDAMGVEKGLDHSILWEEESSVFTLSGTLPMEVLLKIADGLKYTPK